ncbi:MAG: protein kinase [Aquincola sp.]|nr:protein kinase [Aquincola sp.]
MSATTPPADAHHALPVGQRLGEFEIRAVIGVGGFGIVYHAFDHALERDVAIKEYMPGALAARSATLHVSVLSQGHAETFALGLKSFVNEARLLARFDHPSLVKVHRFWEANGTAYMVMPLYRGRTLKALRQGMSESPSEPWLRRLLEPMLGALETLHAQEVFHRDIAPDNILVGDDGRPVLLDFGAARRVISDRSQTLTAILKPSYAPIEQYAEATGLRQGPWTDLYALGATLHFVVTGQAPQPATARALGTDHHLLASQPRRAMSTGFLQIVDWMMAPRPEHRPQNVAALREVLAGAAAAPVPPMPLPAVTAPPSVPWERTAVQPQEAPLNAQAPTIVQHRVTMAPPVPAAHRRAPRWPIAAAAMVIAGVAVAAWRLNTPQPAAEPVVAAITTAPSVAAAPAAAASEAAPTGAIQSDMKEVASSAVLAVAAPATTLPVVAAPVSQARQAKQRRDKARDEPSIDAAASNATAVPAAAEPDPPDAVQLSPREQCEGRHLVALHRCLKRVCQAAVFANHRDCVRMRKVEAANAQRADH